MSYQFLGDNPRGGPRPIPAGEGPMWQSAPLAAAPVTTLHSLEDTMAVLWYLRRLTIRVDCTADAYDSLSGPYTVTGPVSISSGYAQDRDERTKNGLSGVIEPGSYQVDPIFDHPEVDLSAIETSGFLDFDGFYYRTYSDGFVTNNGQMEIAVQNQGTPRATIVFLGLAIGLYGSSVNVTELPIPHPGSDWPAGMKLRIPWYIDGDPTRITNVSISAEWW